MSSTNRVLGSHKEHTGARAARAGASFILGLFANQLADKLSWPPAITLLLVASFFGIAYMLQQPLEVPAGSIDSDKKGMARHLVERILERLVSATPVSLLLGLLVAFISLLPIWDSRYLLVPGIGYVWNYEVLAFAFCIGLQSIIFNLKADALIRIACSAALAFGVAIYVLAQRPESNEVVTTNLGWLIALMLATVVLQLGSKILPENWLTHTYRAITKRRT